MKASSRHERPHFVHLMYFCCVLLFLLTIDAQLLVNGNFESGALTPWSAIATSLASGDAHDGRYYV